MYMRCACFIDEAFLSKAELPLLGLLIVTALYVFEVLCFLKKYKSAIQKNKLVHDHNTRTNMDLHIKPCNTILYKKV